MKYIGSILALVAALVLVLHFVIGSTGNGLLYVAIVFMIAAVITPIVMNAINNRK